MNRTHNKRKYTSILVALAMLTTLFLSLARAEDVPNGSYKRSCKDYRVLDHLLVANCKKRNGDWNPTSIIFRLCSGDIWNDKGDLRCNISQQTHVPKGSYRNSCKDIRFDGKYLKAECKKREGGWRYTDINYKNCDRDIINDDGRLKCGYGYSSLPKGSYKQTCRNARVDGKYLKAECKKNNGSWRYSDIEYDYCDDGIINDNGRLKCD